MASKPGRAPGPGRPKGSENAETKKKRAIRKAIVDYVFHNIDNIMPILAEKKNVQYLVSQAIGRPKESMEVSGDAENPVKVFEIVKHVRSLQQPKDND